jgi:hypothetical protein
MKGLSAAGVECWKLHHSAASLVPKSRGRTTVTRIWTLPFRRRLLVSAPPACWIAIQVAPGGVLPVSTRTADVTPARHRLRPGHRTDPGHRPGTAAAPARRHHATGGTGGTGRTGQPNAAATSTAPVKLTNAGTPTPNNPMIITNYGCRN